MAEQGIPISDAARVMGVSVDSLRKRVQRRNVKAYKGKDGQWRVVLPVLASPGTPDMAADTRETPPEAAHAAMVGTPDDRFARVIEQAIAPYAERLEAVATELGRERVLREQAERRAVDLQAKIDALASPAVPQDAGEQSVRPGDQTPQRVTERPQRASWRWPWQRRDA